MTGSSIHNMTDKLLSHSAATERVRQASLVAYMMTTPSTAVQEDTFRDFDSDWMCVLADQFRAGAAARDKERLSSG